MSSPVTTATLEEVAAAAGVSRSTVSRVINGATAVAPRTLEAVRQAIDELNYVPNRAARSLASRQTNAIALVVPEDTNRFFGDPFFAAIVAGINERLSTTDSVLNLFIASDDPGDKTLRYLQGGYVDGAIVVSHHTSDTFLNRLTDHVPVVFGGRPVTERGLEYYVDVDNVGGARTAVEYLVERGSRSIATITGPLSMPAGVDRREGFESAMRAAGLTAHSQVAGDFTEESGLQAMREILSHSAPDAVFVASDLMARGAYRALREAGLEPGRDVAVVGFDDSSVAVALDPPLTTVRQPSRRQGVLISDVLLRVLAGEQPDRVTVLETEFVVRASA